MKTPQTETPVTHEHIKRAYEQLGFENCGRFLTDEERQQVVAHSNVLLFKKRGR